MDQRIKFYSQNTNLLPPKPKSTFRHLKQGIQDFHRKYVLVPADKAANNVVVVWRLRYINTLKQELSGTKAYKETSEEEKSVVNGHCNHLALKFLYVLRNAKTRLPTMYWLPKLHRGARWLSGSVSDSGAKGRGFETYRRRVVSLSKTLYSPKVLVNYPGSGGSVPTWLKNCWLGR